MVNVCWTRSLLAKQVHYAQLEPLNLVQLLLMSQSDKCSQMQCHTFIHIWSSHRELTIQQVHLGLCVLLSLVQPSTIPMSLAMLF